MHPSRLIGSSLLALLFLLGGCATRPINAPITRIDVDRGYTFQNRQKHFKGQDNLVILAFSGGGTRAAAFSYGVLEFLQRSEVTLPNGVKARLIDAVDVITGVSGGSFTALAYGLYGDKLFADYEQRFLKRNVQGEIISRAFSPKSWGPLSSTGWGRSDWRPSCTTRSCSTVRPSAISIAAPAPSSSRRPRTLSTGNRFVFHPERIRRALLGSGQRPLSRAAAASSAVPGGALARHDQQLRRHLQLRRSALGQTVYRLREPAAPASRAIRALKDAEAYLDSTQAAVHPSRRRWRVRQRRHARRAGRACVPGSAAQRGRANATRPREKDHCLRRQFGVVPSHQLG